MSLTNFNNAVLTEAVFENAIIRSCNFAGADLANANMFQVNLSETALKGANLEGVNLERSILIKTDFSEAKLAGARIYGISAWGVQTEGASQRDLVVTEDGEAEITVDNLEIAQFIYLILNNQKIRDVIDTLTSKSVLILGRFYEERKKVLDAIKDELRQHNYLPIIFDFEKPASRNLTETVMILAKMSRFVVADLTDAKSIPQELSHFIPTMPSLPVVPIILKGELEYAMYEHFENYPWVLPMHEYDNVESIVSQISKVIIEPAENKVKEIMERRRR